MIKEVKLPEIAENVESGTVVEILVSKGDQVEEEQDLVEIETDKATFEVPSTAAGVVQEIKISEGDDIKVGDVILTLETEGKSEEDAEEDSEEDQGTEDQEETEDQETESSEQEDSDQKEQETDKTEQKKQENEESEDQQQEDSEKQKKETKEGTVDVSRDDNGKKESASGTKIAASPAVRRMAREAGVDLQELKGSGPGNRITAEDVKNSGQEPSKTKPVATELPDFSQWGATERKELNKIKQKTAENMTGSWQTVPHVTQFDEADITNIGKFMEEYGDATQEKGGKLTLTSILVKVVGNALKKFPAVNSSLDVDKDELILKKYYNIGVAADTEQGLLVPVLKNVDRKSIIELAVEVTELAQKARDKKLSLDQMQGGNFTISNLGGIGGTNFTPVVYTPQVAILGVARASKKPVWNQEEEKFVPRDILPLSLSYDHRVIDGAEGARFLRWICEAIENPVKMLMEGGV